MEELSRDRVLSLCKDGLRPSHLITFPAFTKVTVKHLVCLTRNEKKEQSRTGGFEGDKSKRSRDTGQRRHWTFSGEMLWGSGVAALPDVIEQVQEKLVLLNVSMNYYLNSSKQRVYLLIRL